MTSITRVNPERNTPFFSPRQDPPAGTAINIHDKTPKVFKPLTIRGTTFHNRLWVAPMCQYSYRDGLLTEWTAVELGSYASRGAALSFIEASAVTPEGRITPEDSGIWSDDHIPAIKHIVDFVHSQGAKIGIQIAHAGRKASTYSPYIAYGAAQAGAENGWPDDVVGPTEGDVWAEGKFHPPHALTKEGIAKLVGAFARAAERAVIAGVDVVEIHAAHGYLLDSFMSPATNKRTDEYGGSLENRLRFPLQVVKAVKAVLPESVLLFTRISAIDWLPKGQGLDIEDSAEFVHLAGLNGVDLVDVSSAGNHVDQDIKIEPGFQAKLANEIIQILKRQGKERPLISSVGIMESPEAILEYANGNDQIDAVHFARVFLKDPSFVLNLADQLGVQVEWPKQYGYAVGKAVNLRRVALEKQVASRASKI